MNKNKSNLLHLYIYNPIEDEWGYISSFPKKEQKILIHNSNRFADSYLFANSLLPSFTFISPIQIDTAFKRYFESLSDTRCTIFTPIPSSPFISQNCVTDNRLFTHIVSEAKKRGGLIIYAYAITKDIYALKKKVEEEGVAVFLPEAPLEKYAWTISHFGCKSGFRKSFSKVMPYGVVTLNYKKAIETAINIYNSSSGVVIKTDKGNAGQGVYMFKKTKQKNPKIILTELKQLFRKEKYLKKNPIIVEAYINSSQEKKSPFPSVEFLIHQNGSIEMQYYCNMIVTPQGEFYGMEMHKQVLTQKITRKVLGLANRIAKKYRDSGYRGRFDIDMIWDGEKLYANESNTRSTGGTDTYYLVKKIIGKAFFTKRYVLSSYVDLPKKITPTFQSLKKMCGPLLYKKNTKIGVIINSESVIKNNGFSYIIIGKNKKESIALHEQLKKVLTNFKKRQ